ncbi:Ig-like domain-containing protein [Aeromonas sp. 604534]|uniref:Ig-like domain-containing protein n=1 Tax=Aeromonas sp. 604534 TaxID=2712055 RepID=UPI003B9E1CFC
MSVGSATISANLALHDGATLEATTTLRVTDEVMTRLQVTPAHDAVAKGMDKPFIATAVLSNGLTRDVTNDSAVSWSSSNITIAAVTSSGSANNGVASGVNPGTVFIKATYLDGTTTFSAQGRLIVKDAAPVSLVVTPDTVSAPKGMTKQFTATVTFSDGTTADVTQSDFTSWTTEGDAATVSSSLPAPELNGVARGEEEGSAYIVATYRSGKITLESKGLLNVTAPVITGVRVSPTTGRVAKGLTRPFQAYFVFSDGSEEEATNSPDMSWRSDDAAIAAITSAEPDYTNGIATGINKGTATITATGMVDGTAFSGSASLEVGDAIARELTISNIPPRLPIGISTPIKALMTLTDGTSEDVTEVVSWSSGDPSIAIITSSQAAGNGKAFGVSVGETPITATMERDGVRLSDTGTLTVVNAIAIGLQVTPDDSTLAKGLSKQFHATAIFSNGEAKDVTAAVDWNVENTAIASVVTSQPSGNGYVKGLEIGKTIIHAKLTTTEGLEVASSGKLEVTNAVPMSYRVTPKRSSVPLGMESTFTAKVKYSDGSESDVSSDPATTWRSSNSAVATVDTDGIASATNTAPTSAAQVSTQIISSTVIDGVEYKDAATLALKTAALWKIEVTPGTYDLPRGLAFNGFKATGYFTDGSTKDITAEKDITWSSAHDKVFVARDERGVVTVSTDKTMPNADKGIPIDIKATSTATGIAGVAHLTVTDAMPVALRMDPITVARGSSKDIGLKVVLSDGDEMLYHHGYSDLIAEASSAAPDIATVESLFGGGIYAVRGNAVGNTTVTVTMDTSTWPDAGSTISTTADVEVTNAVALTLTIEDLPLDGTMVLVSEHKFKAKALMSDGVEEDVTDSVEWKVAVTPDATSAVDWDVTDDTVAAIENGVLSTKAKAGFVRVMAYAPAGSSIGNIGALESSEESVQIERWIPIINSVSGMPREVMVQTNTGKANYGDARDACARVKDRSLARTEELGPLYNAYPNNQLKTMFGFYTGEWYWTYSHLYTSGPVAIKSLLTGAVLGSGSLEEGWVFTCTRPGRS